MVKITQKCYKKYLESLENIEKIANPLKSIFCDARMTPK